jgi:acyl-CoA synthetase (NDP forming)
LQALIDDRNIDVVAVNLEANDPRPKELKSGNRFAAAIEKAAAASKKPIACFSSVVGGPVDPEILLPLRAAGVPLMEGAECAALTIRHLAEYFEFQKNRAAASPRPFARLSADRQAPRVGKLATGILPAKEAFALLERFGIPATPTLPARSADEAAAAAERIGFPVALKVASREITHKSDVGGVALKLLSAAEVRDAYARIRTEVSRRAPGAKTDGVIVQRMAGEGVEMILGVKRDPMFGPVLLCGFGGVLVELLKDVAIGIPPLSRAQAEDMIRRLRAFPVLGGLRGKPPADADALCDALVALSRLAASLADQIAGLDINPLIVLPKGRGVVAVDAVVEVAG